MPEITTNNRVPVAQRNNLEKYVLKNYKKLRYSNLVVDENQSLESFVMDFIYKHNASQTLESINAAGVVQCTAGRRRSLLDIFLLSKTYFPNCTVLEVKAILVKNLDRLRTNLCGQINRMVYLPGNDDHSDLISMDEFGLKLREVKYQ